MKKVLLWVLMVLAFLALLLGGSIGMFYAMAGESALPQQAVQAEDTVLEPIGYDWQLPILGGLAEKRFYRAPNLTVQKLGELAQAPVLTLPDWPDDTQLTLTPPAGGAGFAGSAADFEGYTYTANGSYTVELTLSRRKAKTPADALGWYRYKFSFTLAQQPAVALSDETPAQGDTVAVLITGLMEQAEPEAETDLGAVWFRPVAGGWMGYIPVTYNAETGAHEILVRCGAQQVSTSLSVTPRQSATVADTSTDTETEATAQEYRNAIWPLYTTGSSTKAWQGAFAAPAKAGTLAAYGAVLTREGTRSGRATGITYAAGAEAAAVTAPQAGTVVYAGWLGLTGGTVVIDHGCGVKSYIYGLADITVEKGQQVARGDALGTAEPLRTGEDGLQSQPEHQLIWELRIGSKTVDPAAATAGTGGLQYKENL